MRVRPASMLEAVYSESSSDEGWLVGLVAAIQPAMDQGMGVYGFTYKTTDASITFEQFAELNSVVSKDAMATTVSALDTDYIARTLRQTRFCFGSDDTPFTEMPATKPLVAAGIHDMLIINARAPSGAGVCIQAPLPKLDATGADVRQRWTRVAGHVSAAWRLRSSCSDDPLANHDDRASNTGALREAVHRLDRRRGAAGRSEPWNKLADDRYRVLEQFDHDGRRYVLAVEQDLVEPHPVTLAPREYQVLAAAAEGRTNKVIAYDLGLSDSTVRVLLVRAARKLQVKTRRELVALYNAHVAARESS